MTQCGRIVTKELVSHLMEKYPVGGSALASVVNILDMSHLCLIDFGEWESLTLSRCMASIPAIIGHSVYVLVMQVPEWLIMKVGERPALVYLVFQCLFHFTQPGSSS